MIADLRPVFPTVQSVGIPVRTGQTTVHSLSFGGARTDYAGKVTTSRTIRDYVPALGPLYKPSWNRPPLNEFFSHHRHWCGYRISLQSPEVGRRPPLCLRLKCLTLFSHRPALRAPQTEDRYQSHPVRLAWQSPWTVSNSGDKTDGVTLSRDAMLGHIISRRVELSHVEGDWCFWSLCDREPTVRMATTNCI